MGPTSLDNLLDITIITITITILMVTITITHINETILPAIKEVSMEAVSGGVVEGVVELVSRLVNSAWSKESLEEDRWESLAVRLRADPSTPAGARVDHVGVGSHVLGVQPPVPAAGERHLRPAAHSGDFSLVQIRRYTLP